MKKNAKVSITLVIVGILLILVVVFFPYTFGNKQLIDMHQKFDYAYLRWSDGEQCIPIKTWSDYEGEQIQIVATDGTVYLTSANNLILIKEP